jgi:hypothetical protein
LTSVAASANNKPPGTSHAFHVLPFTTSEYGSRRRVAVMFRAQAKALLRLREKCFLGRSLTRSG